MAKARRPWEVWDNVGTAEQVDDYWTNSPAELDHRAKLARLVKEYLAADSSLLEVGCGTGLVYKALEIQMPGLDYTGIDNSRQMLAIARKRYPGVRFQQGDAFKLKLMNRQFDIACAFEVFGHLPEPWPAVKELVRVASKLAIFTVWPTDGPVSVDCGDHYEHPRGALLKGLAQLYGEREWAVATRSIGPVLAYVVDMR